MGGLDVGVWEGNVLLNPAQQGQVERFSTPEAGPASANSRNAKPQTV